MVEMAKEESAKGRGAQKRQDQHAERERQATLRRWTRPGVLIFLVMLGVAGVGIGLVVQASRRIPVQEATVDGLHLKLEQARWVLDQMDHGENFRKPSVMMPDMPEWGSQRVTLELAFQNRSQESQTINGGEFFLVPERGQEVPPMGALIAEAALAPGHRLNTAIHFDFDTTQPHGKLRVEWRRNGESVYLPIPEPADHYHLRPRGGEVALPPDARLLLPLGKVARGEQLYEQSYGCVACHGDPRVPGSNVIGPHLGGIAAVAGGRIEGVEAAQYLYQSILEPNSFIAPECQHGLPCETPTAMPEYASLITLQDAADLLVYLLAQ